MPALTIPPKEQAQLRELARTTKDAKTAKRILVILALAAGHNAQTRSRALPGKEIRIPGVKASKRKAASEAKGTIDISDELWKEINEL